MNSTATTIGFPPIYVTKHHGLSIYQSMTNWAGQQQSNRMLWAAFAITSQGCVFAPVATLLACLAGLNVGFIIVAMVSMAIPLITNLAALPTKITIPSFFLSVCIDFMIMIFALVSGVHFNSIFA